MKKLFLTLIFVILSSCAHSIHQVHTSDFEIPQSAIKSNTKLIELGKIVKAQSEQFVILGLTQDTDYVNKAYASLLKQCPGAVVGLTTQLSTSLSFFSWTNKVLIQGVCLN